MTAVQPLHRCLTNRLPAKTSRGHCSRPINSTRSPSKCWRADGVSRALESGPPRREQCIGHCINGGHTEPTLPFDLHLIVHSVCGYNTSARQQGKRKAREPDHTTIMDPTPRDEWRRHAAFEFTGCLAHVDITHTECQHTVFRIVGCLEHNDACKAALLARCPPVPLHEHVY